MYRFFIQNQVNIMNHTLIGYEFLIKENSSVGWQSPSDFSHVPVDVMADLLVKTTKMLWLENGQISVNFNREQLENAVLIDALIEAKDQLGSTRLNVELTEDMRRHLVPALRIEQIIQQLSHFNIGFILDDVGSGLNIMDNVAPLLDQSYALKFAMQNFDRKRTDDFEKKLIFWRDVAAYYQKPFLVEGIEDQNDALFLDKLGIDLRQGYYYGKPHLLKIGEDD